MRNIRGFTLIELVVVIVILGILAATAAPKFIDLSSDARIASLQGMQAALNSGSKLIYSKAIIKQKTTGSDTLDLNGVTVSLHSGYPIGNWSNGIRYIVDMDSIAFTASTVTCAEDWCGMGNVTELPSEITTTGLAGKIFPRGFTFNDECGVYYINHEDGSAAVIGLETDDC